MINKVILMGRLTDHPELKHTPSGVAVCTFNLAIDRSYVKQGEERQTDFPTVVCWRGTAEFVTRYFTKGSMIAVVGALQTKKYEDKNGNKRISVEVVADEVSFTGEKRDSAQPIAAAQPFGNAATVEFEEITSGDELPF